MNIITLFKKIWPYVRPYRWLVLVTLILTLIGSLMAQVNAIVLDRTVDAVNGLVTSKSFAWSQAARILTIITIVLLGKEILSALITFAQSYYGERMRIFVSKDLSQAVIDKMLTFRMAFFSRSDNDTGKLQTRIDQGVSSLSSTVQNFFIDLLPLFTSAIIALVLMLRRQPLSLRACATVIHMYIGTMNNAVRPTYTLAANIRTNAMIALVNRGRRSMKKFCTVLLRLLTPWSIRVWSLPVSLFEREKNAMRKLSILSITDCERSFETKMRILSPK